MSQEKKTTIFTTFIILFLVQGLFLCLSAIFFSVFRKFLKRRSNRVVLENLNEDEGPVTDNEEVAVIYVYKEKPVEPLL
jgi:flagellar biogenesis protein FliO